MTPELIKATEKMQPGQISQAGFFGDDDRDLSTIIEEQRVTCRRLGVSWQSIAEAMEVFASQGLSAFGCTLTVDNKWEVCADENRGKVPCPFPHPGMYQKTVYTVRNLRTNNEVRFTDLSIHLIKDHGFFQGKGAPFHNDPADLIEVLELGPTDGWPEVPGAEKA